MERRVSENSPRAGPSSTLSAGESRTVAPSGAAVCPSYYGGGTNRETATKGSKGEATVPKSQQFVEVAGRDGVIYRFPGDRVPAAISDDDEVIVLEEKERPDEWVRRASGFQRDTKGRFVSSRSASPLPAVQPKGKIPVVVLEDVLRPISPRTLEMERTARELGLEMSTDGESVYDSDSEYGGPLRRAGSKRRLDSDDDHPAAEAAEKVPRVDEPPRGRGRPPSTGKYVGQWQAKKEMLAAKRAFEEEDRRELRERPPAEPPAAKPPKAKPEYRPDQDPHGLVGSDLERRMAEECRNILEVARTSGNLKGTCIKRLKEAVAFMEGATEVLIRRSADEEVAMLRSQNRRLRDENKEYRRNNAELLKRMDDLEAEVEKLKKKPGRGKKSACSCASSGAQTFADLPMIEERRPNPVTPEVEAALKALGVGLRFVTPYNVSDDFRDMRHLPRVPHELQEALFGDPEPPAPPAPERAPVPARSSEAPTRQQAPAPLATTRTKTAGSAPAATSPAVEGSAKKKKKKGKKKSLAALRAPDAELMDMQSIPARGDWQTVGPRKGPKKKAAAPPKPREEARKATPAKPRPRAQQLRVPRTSAIVITMQPGGVEKGLNYAKVINTAAAHIQWAELGLPRPLCKPTAADGRKLIIPPGEGSEAKADLLASKLREIFSAEELKVSRPVKTAELGVSLLDDSVTREMIAAAIAEKGRCDVAQIKCGEIKKGPQKMGQVWVRCPVSAAKVVARDRLAVGWSSARVELFGARPLQCHKCLKLGHTKALCQEEGDRSDLCFRCGQAGHVAATCREKPHCVSCAAAGKAADHRGGRSQCLEAKRRGAPKAAGASVPKPRPPRPQPSKKRAGRKMDTT